MNITKQYIGYFLILNKPDFFKSGFFSISIGGFITSHTDLGIIQNTLPSYFRPNVIFNRMHHF